MLDIPSRKHWPTSSTNYAPLAAPEVGVLRSPISTEDGKLAEGMRDVSTHPCGNTTFDVLCGVVMQEGQAGLKPINLEVSTRTLRNVAVQVMYRVDHCFAVCANLNDPAPDKNLFSPMCQTITFVPSMKSALSQFPGSCFLKNSTQFDLKQAAISVNPVSAEVSGLRG